MARNYNILDIEGQICNVVYNTDKNFKYAKKDS